MTTLQFSETVDFNYQTSHTINLRQAFQTQWSMIVTKRSSSMYGNLSISGVIRRTSSTSSVKASLKFSDGSPAVILQFDIGQETSKTFELPWISSSYRHPINGSLTLHSFSCGTDKVWDSNNFKSQSLDYLSKSFMDMLQSANQFFSDVSLKCGNVVLPAHKCILSSRSSVFEAMFRSNMKDAKEGIIRITDIDATVLKEMLNYIYTGQTAKLTVPLASLLLFAADKYQLALLKDACVKFLISNVSCDNVLSILMLGELHDLKLKNCALEFICYCEKVSQLEVKPEWKILKTDKPDLAMEVLLSVVKFQQENKIPGLEMGKVNPNCNQSS